MSKVEKYTQEAIRIANDNRHGYSQYHRRGPDYDCSSLVITCVQDAGIPVKSKGATYTGNMLPAFKACGFVDVANKVNFYTGAGLQYGDILLNTGYHTEIYIGNGRTVGAKSDEKGGIAGNLYGDQTGREIRTGYYYNYPWYHALRYQGGGSSSSYKPSSGAKRVKYEKGHGVTQAVCNVRSGPSLSSSVVAQYGKGQTIYYDQVWEGNGYRWISYIGASSGKRRYVAYRKTSGDTSPWIKFCGGSSSSYKPSSGAKRVKYENWHGRTQAVCNVRSAPSTKAPIVAVYPKGSWINYDQVREGDGYRWISYISYSGKRRYVAYRKTSGDTSPWIKF